MISFSRFVEILPCLCLLQLLHFCLCSAFVLTPSYHVSRMRPSQEWVLASTSSTTGSNLNDPVSADRSQLENFLNENFPTLYSVLFQKKENVLKIARVSEESDFTVFAPNEDAFTALGEKRKQQLLDPRNGETAQKIAAYHFIRDESVPMETLLNENIGGILTLGGEVRVAPSVAGGLFGLFGGKNDGGVVLGSKARVVKSFIINNGIVHEIDALISPEILWRYMDQLRIPGI